MRFDVGLASSGQDRWATSLHGKCCDPNDPNFRVIKIERLIKNTFYLIYKYVYK